jgi:hypothetical protein
MANRLMDEIFGHRTGATSGCRIHAMAVHNAGLASGLLQNPGYR